MAFDAKLLFFRPADGSAKLVFGDVSEVSLPETSLVVEADFEGDMEASVQILWDANVSRGERHAPRGLWQSGEPAGTRASGIWQQANPFTGATQFSSQDAEPRSSRTQGLWQQSDPVRGLTQSSSQNGEGVRHALGFRWQSGDRLRSMARSSSQDADPLRRILRAYYQAAEPLRQVVSTRWQEAEIRRLLLRHTAGKGLPLRRVSRGFWQEAEIPPPGLSLFVPPPEAPDLCYDPETLGRLEFDAEAALDGRLIFVCLRGYTPPPVGQIVVPVRRIYMTLNSLDLRRVDGGVSFPTTGFSLQVDVDSWTWSWSATCSMEALALLDPGAGELVEMEAEINGTLYRLYAEEVSLSRTFGKSSVSISGRGLAAEIADPVAPVLNFSAPSSRLASQLATEALQLNGVGIGWTLDWGLVDWTVPGGVWSHQGTHLTAVQAIVAAAGGYIQPTPFTRTLRVLHRAPVASWAWPGEAAGVVLPSDPVTVEGIRWIKAAPYNRVYVSGQANGILGRVSRGGTAGDVLAEMVVDPLITGLEAARQRGRAILSAGGNQALVSLTLPVLSSTGFILPGTLLEYTDNGVSRKGLVRSSALSWNRPRLRQSLTVETHEVA